MAQLEEEDAQDGKEQESDDPDGIKGVMEEFMVQLARAVKDAQMDEKCSYHCSSPEHFICNCLLMKAARDKKQLNGKEGMVMTKKAWTPPKATSTVKSPLEGGSGGIKSSSQTPFLNSDPFQHWYGIENIAKVKINGESCMSLLDNGVQVNTIMPRYVKEHSLQVGPITDLMGSKVGYVGLGNAYTRLLGYVVIRVQVDGVQGYDEDQIVLIILDFSNFATRVPIILGTPTIGQVVNMMREVEMDALAMPWPNARAAHLLAVRRMTPVEVGNDQEEGYDIDKDIPLMYTQIAETLEPFSSHVIPGKTTKAYLGEHLNVKVQALYVQDGTLLPGLTVQNAYTELRKGSKKAVVVVQNNTTYPQTLRKKTPVARAISVLPVPEPPEPKSLQVEKQYMF